MRTAIGYALGATVILSLSGCHGGDAVRALGAKEKAAFAALDDRLAENELKLKKAVGTLGDLGADYTELEFEYELALAKAKRLESMQAPWANPTADLAATQRAVILYHLYETERAEHAVLQARINERRAAAADLLTSYRTLRSLTADAADNVAVVLEHLNQPPSARIRAFTDTFLNEVTAFREQLADSENPRLRKLAEDVERAEDRAREAKTRAEDAIERVLENLPDSGSD